MKLFYRQPFHRSAVVLAIYFLVVLIQLYMWPECEDPLSSTLSEDIEDAAVDLPPLPHNIFNPPMWNSLYSSDGCGTWQKEYTKLHKDITSGKQPASYLVYATGTGFPPAINSIPETMKGIATVLMLAILTDRAFILDWRSPSGFDNVFVPRYIDWTVKSLPDEDLRPIHVHTFGAASYIDRQAGNAAQWYMDTDFDDYFSNEVEVVQAHSYDFTFALLRNKHYQHKIQRFGLHRSCCRLCCMWHYLFKFTVFFQTRFKFILRELRFTKSSEMIYINVPLPSQNLPPKLVESQVDRVMACAGKVSSIMKHPIWVVASNNFRVLEDIYKDYPRMAKALNGIFYSTERYWVDLRRQNSSTYKSFRIPRTEQNALLYFFIGYYLQMNSTVLFSQRNFLYSEVGAAIRHFSSPRKTYVVYPEESCQMQRYLHK